MISVSANNLSVKLFVTKDEERKKISKFNVGIFQLDILNVEQNKGFLVMNSDEIRQLYEDLKKFFGEIPDKTDKSYKKEVEQSTVKIKETVSMVDKPTVKVKKKSLKKTIPPTSDIDKVLSVLVEPKETKAVFARVTKDQLNKIMSYAKSKNTNRSRIVDTMVAKFRDVNFSPETPPSGSKHFNFKLSNNSRDKIEKLSKKYNKPLSDILYSIIKYYLK